MSFMRSIIAVTFAFVLIAGNPVEEWEYLRDCDEICPRRPEAHCQVRCLRIIHGKGYDCVNMFYDSNNHKIDCFFF